MTEFRDIRGHWAEGCIEKLVGLGLVKGYPDGTFQPDHFVTRAEFAAFAVRAFPNQPVIRQAIVFKDLSATHWAYGAVSQAYRQGFLSGYADRTFRPAENILRVHGLISLASGLKLP
ncbi:MAG: S-layer homology domain-containing protein [Microcoleaceae cyanobacterium]